MPSHRAHLHADESSAFAEVSFGPVGGQVDGALRVSQGQGVLVQTAVAVRAIPKEPGRGSKPQNSRNLCQPNLSAFLFLYLYISS